MGMALRWIWMDKGVSEWCMAHEHDYDVMQHQEWQDMVVLKNGEQSKLQKDEVAAQWNGVLGMALRWSWMDGGVSG